MGGITPPTPILIDNFNAGGTRIARSTGVTNYSDAFGLGGSRDVQLFIADNDFLGGFAGILAASFYSFRIFNGLVDRSHTFRLRCDGATNDPASPPSTSTFLANTTGLVQIRVNVSTASALQVGSQIAITLYDGTASATVTQSVTTIGDKDFLLSAFTGINLANIRAIELLATIAVDTVSTGEIRLDNFSIV